jgi:cysteine desulfuration protein SufE
MVEELLALSTPEDRLSFLMERPHIHLALEPHERSEARKVPGCLSGLWLKADIRDGACSFSAYSESDLVHGVVSFICDLYSNRSTAEVTGIGGSLVDLLKLDGLLSTTRKRAVYSTLAFIQNSVQSEVDSTACATANAA